MSTKQTKGVRTVKSEFEKEENKREFRKNLITGAILRSIHKKQGTMPYLLYTIEPYLKKPDRQLFGLPI